MEITIWIKHHRWRWTHSQNSGFNPHSHKKANKNHKTIGAVTIWIWSPIWIWRCWQKVGREKEQCNGWNQKPSSTHIGRQTFLPNVWLRYRLEMSSLELLTSLHCVSLLHISETSCSVLRLQFSGQDNDENFNLRFTLSWHILCKGRMIWWSWSWIMMHHQMIFKTNSVIHFHFHLFSVELWVQLSEVTCDGRK